MSNSYEEMWESLNLGLESHAGLPQAPGKFYGDIYMSRQGCLRGIEYLDFVLSEVHGLRIKELQDAKAQGKNVVGTFCVFVPEEIVLAAGGIPMLSIETDYSMEDVEQIKTRVESFVEMTR